MSGYTQAWYDFNKVVDACVRLALRCWRSHFVYGKPKIDTCTVKLRVSQSASPYSSKNHAKVASPFFCQDGATSLED